MSRASVHKSADREVLITDARQLTGDRYAVAARWSRNHLLGHRPEALTSDPLLLVETVRQAAIHLAHRFLDVPAGHPFVMQDLDFELLGDRLPGAAGPGCRCCWTPPASAGSPGGGSGSRWRRPCWWTGCAAPGWGSAGRCCRPRRTRCCASGPATWPGPGRSAGRALPTAGTSC
ncbi:AfsA-related hotdog domain-containing protein [Kitasatospora gansuensis]